MALFEILYRMYLGGLRKTTKVDVHGQVRSRGLPSARQVWESLRRAVNA